MIVAGKRSLQNNELDSAKLYFTAAYECGMSKDTLYYYVAEIYLRRGSIDTALVFNWALERNGVFDRETCLKQRSRIYRTVGWRKKADSLSSGLTRKGTEQSVSLGLSGGRDIMSLAPVSFLPYDLTVTPDPDIDDEGYGRGSYQISYTTGNDIQRLFLRCSIEGDIPLFSRYSFHDSNDTLMGTLEVSGGIGRTPVTPEFQVGYRLRVHETFKKDHFYLVRCTYVPMKTILLGAECTIKQVREGIDEFGTALTVMKIFPRFRLFRYVSGSFKHYFSRTDVYQEEAGATGTIHPFLPTGFVDSLAHGERFEYYRDEARTIPFNSNFLDEYWNAQPRMKLLRPLPEHNFNLTLKHVWRFRFPGNVQCNVFNSVAGVLYPKPVEWFVPEEPLQGDVGYILRNMYLKYAIIRNGADGSYYLNEERSDLYANSFMKLTHHKKRRIDCYITLSFLFERNIGKLGTIYFSTGYLKGFSTIRPGDPVATFDYGVNLRAGWRGQFSLEKK